MENKRTIIYAEDEASIMNMYKMLHEKMLPNYDAEFYNDGESLEARLKKILIKNNGVKVITLDNDIKTGKQGSELIREYSQKLNIPMILCYGGDDSIGQKALENGAYKFFLKPFSMVELYDTLNDILNPSE